MRLNTSRFRVSHFFFTTAKPRVCFVALVIQILEVKLLAELKRSMPLFTYGAGGGT